MKCWRRTKKVPDKCVAAVNSQRAASVVIIISQFFRGFPLYAKPAAEDTDARIRRPSHRAKPLQGSRLSRHWTFPTFNLRPLRSPLAVGTPRAVRAAAMAYGSVMPLALISAMTGASATARASARAVDARRAASRACGVGTALTVILSP